MDPMRIFITLIISMICFWGSAQSAYACYGYHRLSKMDVAFADIVFNGKIKDIKGDVFTFEVVNVERGKLSTKNIDVEAPSCLLYTSPSPRDKRQSRMPSSA